MSIYDLLKNEEQSSGGRVQGVAIGIVCNNKDPEGLGRVKLTFPWRGNSDESHWVRVATPMAGKDMGVFLLPEVDSEVLVAFDQGDVEHPYVIGSLWNGKEEPPEGNGDGKNNIRKIRSRSGHEIVFDDTEGSEKIEVKDSSGSNTITVDSASNTITIKSSAKLEIKSNSIVIEADNDMTIKAGTILTLEGKTQVKIN